MFIIVAGGGRIGYHVSKKQLQKMNEVVILEKRPERCSYLLEVMGSVVVQGDACDPSVLENAGISRAEMIIACTGKDQDNLIICQLARKKFRVPYTIALLNDPANEEVFKKLGVDATINYIGTVLGKIEQKVAHQGAMTVLMREAGFEIIETRLHDDTPASGKNIGQLPLPQSCIVSAVIRGGELLPTSPDTGLLSGDVIITVSKESDFQNLKKAFLGFEIAQHVLS